MKNTILALFLLGICLTSCSTENQYEKIISDFVQTDKSGTKYDMKFKVIELKEVQKISVADSSKILLENFNTQTAQKTNRLEKTIKENKTSIQNEQNKRIKSDAMIKMYQQNIEKYTQILDSIKSIPFVNPYENRKQDEILAVLVECTYSIVPPIVNTTAQETKEFIVAPAGDKVYSAKKIKK